VHLNEDIAVAIEFGNDARILVYGLL